MGLLGAILGGVVGFFVGGPVGAAVGFGIGMTNAGEKVINSVLDFVLSPFLGPMGAPEAGANEAERQQGVLVQKEGSNVNIPVIYGLRRAGGIVTFAGTGSDKNKYLWVVYVFSEGLVEGLHSMSIDDVEIESTYLQKLNAGELVDVAQGKFNGRVQMRWYPGQYYDTPSASPVGTTVGTGIFSGCPDWNTKMVYNGLAVLFARYEWKDIVTQADADNNPFNGNIPKIQATILGRRVQQLATKSYLANNVENTMTSSTLTTISNNYWTNQPTYSQNSGVYTTNPVEILHDYLRNPRYGKGLAISEFDKETWINAANKCNQNVQYYTGVIGPIMTCNYALNTDQTLMTNVKTLLSGFRGYMPYVQGKYKLKIEDAGHPTDVLSGVATIVQTITKNQIVGDVTYTAIERTAKYNQVVVTYVDPDQKWSNQQAVWPQTEAERQVYIAEDGGRENKGEMTMGTLTNSIMALDMARLIFNKSRYQESCSVKISAQGFELEPGDNIYIQSNILNFGTIPWRIITIKLNTDYTFDLGCVRNPDNIYPYGRYGEPDIVLATHIPQGNTIYYAPPPGLIGITPPTSAVLPPAVTTVPPGNVLPTKPSDPVFPGGGVGAPDAPINKNPPIVIPEGVTSGGDDILDFTTASYINGSWVVNFSKTAISQYAGVRFWYRPSTTTVFTELPELSSGATSVSFTASTDTAITYTIISRVKYSNGNYSTDVTQALLSRNVGLVAGSEVRVEDFTFGSNSVQDTSFTNLAAMPFMVSATNSSPLTTPRTVTFVVKEQAQTGINPSTNIRSIKVYYKPKGSTDGYNVQEQSIAAYSPNSSQAVTLPSAFANATTEWDIAIKFTFANGSEGTKAYMDTITTSTAGASKTGNPYYIYDAALLPLAQPTTVVISDAYATVTSINGASNATAMMHIRFKDPTAQMSTFSGADVYISRLVEGQPIAYNIRSTQLKTEMGRDFSTGEYIMAVSAKDFQYKATYNIILRLMYTTGSIVSASTQAVKFTGRYYGANQFNQITGNPTNGLAAINDPAGTFLNLFEPSGTRVPMGTGDRRVIVPFSITAWAQNPDPLNLATPKVSSFNINFAVPDNFSKLRVYRRRRATTASGVPGPLEYSDITESGFIRHAIYSLTDVSQGRYSLTVQPDEQEIYLRLFDAGGNPSLSVTHYFVNAYGVTWGNPKSIIADKYDLESETSYLPNNPDLELLIENADLTETAETRVVRWYDSTKTFRYGSMK